MSVQGVLGKGHGRRLRLRRGVAMVVAVGAAMLGALATTATSASGNPAGAVLKDCVCK